MFAALMFFGCGGEAPVVAASDCPSSQTLCDGQCLDLSSSPLACGACGEPCAGGEVCSDGVCELQCAEGLVNCEGACIDPTTDRDFCGASADCSGANEGADCDDTEVCSGGSCQLNCTGGTLLCDGRCADPMFDPDYCGATGSCAGAEAGTVCDPADVCDQGNCRSSCGPDSLVCGSGCVDPRVNPRFCGATGTCEAEEAGTICGGGEVCVDGTCVGNCVEGQIDCNGRCIDPRTDRFFCGASGTCTGDEAGQACGADSACLGGVCFGTDTIFVSSRNQANYAYPRPVNFTLDSRVDGITIHFTTDGTDPEVGGAATFKAMLPLSVSGIGTAASPEVRYIIEYAGEFSDIRSVVNNTFTPDNNFSLGFIIENLDLNGDGPVIRASPGQRLNYRMDAQYWRSSSGGFCPGCFVQAVLAFESAGLVSCQEVQSTWPGTNQFLAGGITAPNEPGLYFLRFRTDLQFGCSTVSGTSTGGTPIGLVEVVQ